MWLNSHLLVTSFCYQLIIILSILIITSKSIYYSVCLPLVVRASLVQSYKSHHQPKLFCKYCKTQLVPQTSSNTSKGAGARRKTCKQLENGRMCVTRKHGNLDKDKVGNIRSRQNRNIHKRNKKLMDNEQKSSHTLLITVT